MKIVGLVGATASDRETLRRRIASRLSQRGSVATVRRTDHERTERERADAVDRADELTDDGTWVGSGQNRSLDDVLERLAPEYDYAIADGFHDAEIPTVSLGETTDDDETIVTAADPESVDVDVVVDVLDEQDSFETLESLVAAVKRSPDSEFAGAIATFTGRVRTKEGPADTATDYLEFERYDGVAEQKMEVIKEELEARDGVYEVLLHHRTGVVESEEDIVFVVVLAGHRSEAFETVEDGINRLKDEVPLFKKEVTVDDEFWAHEPQIED